MAVLFRGECRRCLSSVKFQKGEAVVTEQTFFWRRSRLFDNKQPKPDLAVPLSSVVACRESFLGKEQLLLLSLRSGEQLRFCSENFSALWSALQGALRLLKTQQDPEQTARQQQVKANGQAIAAEQEQKGEKTKRYTPSMQQRAEQAARLREEASRQAQEERARLQKQRPPRAPIQPPVSEKPAAVPGSFCPQCGKKVDPIDQYCLHCGCRLRGPGKEGEKEQKATVNP